MSAPHREYTGWVRTVEWDPAQRMGVQLSRWCDLARRTGIVHVVFGGEARRERLGWPQMEGWTRTRAVTVAEIRSNLGAAALDAALCADLVYAREDVDLQTGNGEASAGLLWALGRAGRAALSRGLLDAAPIPAAEAAGLGLVQGVLEHGAELPVTDRVSLTALTTARDMMRSAPEARSILEMASFRLLFASGDPGEGARAFLERRHPEFD
jgi:enoyl-CoA hydratase/carnithine racemase